MLLTYLNIVFVEGMSPTAYRVNLSVFLAGVTFVSCPRTLRTALIVRRKRLLLYGTVQWRTRLPSTHHRRIGARALGAPVRMRSLAGRCDLVAEQTSASRRVHQLPALSWKKKICHRGTTRDMTSFVKPARCPCKRLCTRVYTYCFTSFFISYTRAVSATQILFLHSHL